MAPSKLAFGNSVQNAHWYFTISELRDLRESVHEAAVLRDTFAITRTIKWINPKGSFINDVIAPTNQKLIDGYSIDTMAVPEGYVAQNSPLRMITPQDTRTVANACQFLAMKLILSLNKTVYASRDMTSEQKARQYDRLNRLAVTNAAHFVARYFTQVSVLEASPLIAPAAAYLALKVAGDRDIILWGASDNRRPDRAIIIAWQKLVGNRLPKITHDDLVKAEIELLRGISFQVLVLQPDVLIPTIHQIFAPGTPAKTLLDDLNGNLEEVEKTCRMVFTYATASDLVLVTKPLEFIKFVVTEGIATYLLGARAGAAGQPRAPVDRLRELNEAMKFVPGQPLPEERLLELSDILVGQEMHRHEWPLSRDHSRTDVDTVVKQLVEVYGRKADAFEKVRANMAK